MANARRISAALLGILAFLFLSPPLEAAAQAAAVLPIRGKAQALHVYGDRAGVPVILSSGDGGWVHLAPQVAQLLAARGYFVVGFDSKAYLESFTSGTATLRESDVPGDYRELIGYAGGGPGRKPLLIGVSEGAGLSVLAAADASMHEEIGGVIALSLGDANELGWRWKDALIYVTHGVPNEPAFSVAAIAGRVAPTPLAVINSSRDEFVPKAEIDRIIAAGRAPKRLWVIDAADHRFSDQQPELARRLDEALAWVRLTERGGG